MLTHPVPPARGPGRHAPGRRAPGRGGARRAAGRRAAGRRAAGRVRTRRGRLADRRRFLVHDGRDALLEPGDPVAQLGQWDVDELRTEGLHLRPDRGQVAGRLLTELAGHGEHQLGRQGVRHAVHAAVVDRGGEVLRDDDVHGADQQDHLEGDRHGVAAGAARERVGLVAVGRGLPVGPDQGEGHVVGHGAIGGVHGERLVVAGARGQRPVEGEHPGRSRGAGGVRCAGRVRSTRAGRHQDERQRPARPRSAAGRRRGQRVVAAPRRPRPDRTVLPCARPGGRRAPCRPRRRGPAGSARRRATRPTPARRRARRRPGAPARAGRAPGGALPRSRRGSADRPDQHEADAQHRDDDHDDRQRAGEHPRRSPSRTPPPARRTGAAPTPPAVPSSRGSDSTMLSIENAITGTTSEHPGGDHRPRPRLERGGLRLAPPARAAARTGRARSAGTGRGHRSRRRARGSRRTAATAPADGPSATPASPTISSTACHPVSSPRPVGPAAPRSR